MSKKEAVHTKRQKATMETKKTAIEMSSRIWRQLYFGYAYYYTPFNNSPF